MGRFLGEGTCFLFDSEPIDLPDNRILCRTSRDCCRINRTAGLVIRLLTKFAAYNAGRLQICRNETICRNENWIANLPERLAGTEDSRGQTLRPAELCRGHSRAGPEHGSEIFGAFEMKGDGDFLNGCGCPSEHFFGPVNAEIYEILGR